MMIAAAATAGAMMSMMEPNTVVEGKDSVGMFLNDFTAY